MTDVKLSPAALVKGRRLSTAYTNVVANLSTRASSTSIQTLLSDSVPAFISLMYHMIVQGE